MNRLIVFCLCILLFSCKKSEQTPYYTGYYGRWQYIGYNFAAINAVPSPDSVVVLNLMPGNSYQTTLNGQIATRGTFSIDSGMNGTVLTFNNITEPAGNNTMVTVGGITYFSFNYDKIGQLLLYEQNRPDFYGDSLILGQEFMAPESTTNYFRKLP
jgi:hypothetical protein